MEGKMKTFIQKLGKSLMGRLFLCLGITLTMSVTQTVKSRTQ